MRFGWLWFMAGLLLSVVSLSTEAAGEDLVDAAAAGRVEIQITGLGASTGDSMVITVRRLVPETLRLTLAPGTMIKSGNQQTQDMVTAKIKGERIPGDENRYWVMSEIVLADDRTRSFIVEAYCLDFDKENPNRGSTYRLLSVDPRAKKIILAGKERNVTPEVLQASIWIDRAGLSDSALKQRFPVDDKDIKAARSLLADIDAEPVKATGPKPMDPETVRAPKKDWLEIGRKGNFILFANGIMRDTKTGLEWFVAPLELQKMGWREAKSWAENLSLDGGGWRMPSCVGDESFGRDGFELLQIERWGVYCGPLEGSSTVLFAFDHERKGSRAVAVRKR